MYNIFVHHWCTRFLILKYLEHFFVLGISSDDSLVGKSKKTPHGIKSTRSFFFKIYRRQFTLSARYQFFSTDLITVSWLCIFVKKKSPLRDFGYDQVYNIPIALTLYYHLR